MSNREHFTSRAGFLLVSAGCAIGLGNVWRFPYITGEYGGALFVVLYIALLALIGVPLMTVELAVGRASRLSIASCFDSLGEHGNPWAKSKYLLILGNYVLMSFYGLVTGWLLYYAVRMATGGIGQGATQAEAGATFGGLLADPVTQLVCMLVCMATAFGIVMVGLQKGVERITKPLMTLLLLMLMVLALYALTLPGCARGVSYYLLPNLASIEKHGFAQVLWAAMGQAFFTLGLGVGSIEIFGTYCDKKHTLLSESVSVASIDTAVALIAGLVIFPVCFTYDVAPSSGPGLLFVSLTTVFSNLPGGVFWGTLFFLFMLFAAMSTLIAVYENIVAINMEFYGISRKKSVLLNFVAVVTISMPVLLGFNVWSDFHPMGAQSCVLDLMDFILSNNILPIGAIVFLFFVTARNGMTWMRFLREANEGEGLKLSGSLRCYFKYVLPLVVLILLVAGYVTLFWK